MYSMSRTDRMHARIKRALPGIMLMPMAMMAFRRLGPNTAASVTVSRNMGMPW